MKNLDHVEYFVFPLTAYRPRHNLAPQQLSREEERLIRYYRLLSEQDREALRCLFFAIKETSRAEQPKR
ncbi:hypothetical protein CUU62_00955 [Pseudomonas sp. WP001]|nr:hypothetical protein CUU62_00955 [Pseudomonas sp. WP001]